MFGPLFFIGLLLFLGGLFGSRFLAERATKLLSAEEKLALLDSFHGLRVFGALPLVLLVFSFFGITYLPPVWIWPAYFAGWALLTLYFGIMHQIISRRLTELGINATYRAAHNRARLLSYFGFLAFFVLNTLSPLVGR
jgi:hypothetical protein